MDNNEPAALMKEAEEADQDGAERLSVSERLKLMTKREKTEKGDDKTEATQSPKRTSMSIADRIAQMQGRGSAGTPPPQPVEPSESSPFSEFKLRIAKKGGGIAERIAKLQAGAGDGATAPPGSPASAHDRSGSATAPRHATVAGGANGTDGAIAAHTQKLGGGAGIVLPGVFEALHPATVTCEPARTSPRSERKRARSCRRPACKPARRRTRALARVGRPAHPRRDKSSSAPDSSRPLLLLLFFTSVLLRFSRCWRREEASARGADEPHNVDERRRRPITGRRRRHQYRGSSHR